MDIEALKIKMRLILGNAQNLKDLAIQNNDVDYMRSVSEIIDVADDLLKECQNPSRNQSIAPLIEEIKKYK